MAWWRQAVLGTHMYHDDHDVYRLFEVVSCAERRLTRDTLSAYLAVLGNREMHENALVEFARILRLDS